MSSTPDIRRILVAHDFGKVSDAALDYGLGLGRRLGAQITVVHAYEVPTFGAPEVLVLSSNWTKQCEIVARQALDKVATHARERGFGVESMLREGRAWREVVAAAEETNADLVVVGSEGRHGVTPHLLGSVAEKIVRMAPCPVLVVRHAREERQASL
jgi:universal stress protein A